MRGIPSIFKPTKAKNKYGIVSSEAAAALVCNHRESTLHE